MKLYAQTTSDRSSKGQGGNEFLNIVISGSHQTELITLNIKPDGPHYRLTGYTHDNHYIDMKIEENMTTKPEPRTCPNCESPKGYANSSSEWQCDNCGYSETE